MIEGLKSVDFSKKEVSERNGIIYNNENNNFDLEDLSINSEIKNDDFMISNDKFSSDGYNNEMNFQNMNLQSNCDISIDPKEPFEFDFNFIQKSEENNNNFILNLLFPFYSLNEIDKESPVIDLQKKGKYA